ncbi:UNVERIFIED_CONTAM: hypothetical protein Slati_4368300 [Sesamum latifolium]|uniref:Arf-GAP domain-containing protein n=1 Tax=Sesamum latifolium TaxID=2727402 RepID=A0AAW2SQV9_9LAMI
MSAQRLTFICTLVCTSSGAMHNECLPINFLNDSKSEFTHRVKSVSMAKFNEEEITALQAGGNGRAREIYFKAWDPLRNNLPDNRVQETRPWSGILLKN